MKTSRYAQINFIDAVPAGASETGTIKLAPGAYYLYFVGTQTAATTDPTLEFDVAVNEAGTVFTNLNCGLSTDTALAATADLEVAQAGLYGVVGNQAVGTVDGNPSGPVLVPYGILQYVYTKNGGTAVDLTLVAVPADPASL
jgi:hypothetical protein